MVLYLVRCSFGGSALAQDNPWYVNFLYYVYNSYYIGQVKFIPETLFHNLFTTKHLKNLNICTQVIWHAKTITHVMCQAPYDVCLWFTIFWICTDSNIYLLDRSGGGRSQERALDGVQQQRWESISPLLEFSNHIISLLLTFTRRIIVITKVISVNCVMRLRHAGYFSHISTMADVHEHVQVCKSNQIKSFIWLCLCLYLSYIYDANISSQLSSVTW